MDPQKKIRYIDEVIDDFIKIIPDSESGLSDLLKKYSDSLWNIAPECKAKSVYFAKVRNILERNVGEINSEWKEKLVAEWEEIIVDVNEYNRQ